MQKGKQKGGGLHSQGGRGGSHAQGGHGGSHTQGGHGGSHAQGGRGGSHTQGGRGGSHAQGGRGGSHAQGGRGGSHAQKGGGGSHSQGVQGGSHVQGGRGGSNAQGGRGRSHGQEGRGGSHVQGGRGGSHAQGVQGGSHAQGGRGGSNAQGGRGRSHVQGGRSGSHAQGGQDGSHAQGGRGGSHAQGGRSGSLAQGGQDGSHAQGGRGGSHAQGGQGGSHSQGVHGGSHAQGGRGGSHAQKGGGGSHAQGGRGGSHAQGGRGGSHAQGGRGGSHAQGGRDGSHAQGGRGGSHAQGGRGGSHAQGRHGGSHAQGERSGSERCGSHAQGKGGGSHVQGERDGSHAQRGGGLHLQRGQGQERVQNMLQVVTFPSCASTTKSLKVTIDLKDFKSHGGAIHHSSAGSKPHFSVPKESHKQRTRDDFTKLAGSGDNTRITQTVRSGLHARRGRGGIHARGRGGSHTQGVGGGSYSRSGQGQGRVQRPMQVMSIPTCTSFTKSREETTNLKNVESHDRTFHAGSKPCSSATKASASCTCITSDEITKLASLNESSMVTSITQNVSGFVLAFKYEPFLKNPKILKQLIHILYKLIKSRNPRVAYRILAELFAYTGEHALFMFHLNMLLKAVPEEATPFIRSENLLTVFHLLEISKFCFDKIPKIVEHTFPISAVRAAAEALVSHDTSATATLTQAMLELESQLVSIENIPVPVESNSKKDLVEEMEPPQNFATYPISPLPDETNQLESQLMGIEEVSVPVKSKLKKDLPEDFTTFPILPQPDEIDQLEAQLMDIEEIPAPIKSKSKRDSAEDMEPPQHFTTLPILPLPDEINQYAGRPFLRPNIVKGKYCSWDHYLDVQFRLLREDFVGPLRDGIEDHLLNCSRCGGEVHVYNNVRLKQPVCLEMGIGFEVSFDVQTLQRVNWEYTKRLINGSLLCLSTDNFAAICFATVAQRDARQLKDGIITVKFEGINGFTLDAYAQYTMVESIAYFEAYRHILEKLQAVSQNHDLETMPFQQYIVDIQFGHIPLPKFLIPETSGQKIFDLENVIQVKSMFSSAKVDLANLASWPDAELTNLDSSQMKALQAALTQEISVIQGPPGTGKTYVGMKIVKAFLANREVWDPKRTTPILVVCYTNRALDQFLEGIRSDEIQGKQPNVMRIGGRCKSEVLKDCTLQEKVSNAQKQKAVPKKEFIQYAEARDIKNIAKESIINDLNNLYLSATKVLELYQLSHVISPQHLLQLTAALHTDNPIELWLDLQYAETRDEETIADTEMDSQACTVDIGMQGQQERFDSDDEGIVYGGQTQVQILCDNQFVEEHLQALDINMQTTFTASLDDEVINEEETEVQMVDDDRLVEGNEIVFRAAERLDNSRQESTTKEKNDGDKKTVKLKRKRLKLIKKQLSCGLKPMSADEVRNVQNLWSLSRNQKWRLYLHWREKYASSLRQQLAHLSQSYKIASEELQQKRHQINLAVVQGSDVIGMTTTGAAKHNYIIKAIRPKVVIVEEAAEIFEPHVFTFLSPSVQQLILIGDHQQLRPKPAYYKLEEHYDFSVSLFERLAINDCPVQTLSIQHRMRPEIASLITPSIYSELLNHESVQNFPHIKGISKDLFFITHTEPEATGVDDRKSHSNPHEAKYLGALCEYLLKQDYKPAEMTILTQYRGQLLEIKKILRKPKFTGIRTVVIDDFQGEENEIILLSLVRSNIEKRIGYVAVENRVCVALSRAKKGLYIIGNKEILYNDAETVWPAVIKQLESMDSIGESLPLHCHKHRDYQVNARHPRDFQKCPDGGCMRSCNARLPCGHVCPRKCHSYDPKHLEFKCTRICNKQLPCGHKCTEECHKCCEGCLPCKVEVTKTLPECDHSQNCACSDNVSEIKCSHICEKVLDCGHFCQKKCSEPCSTKCMSKVDKHLPCGHTVQDSCYLKEELVECPVECGAILDCGHPCPGTCHTCKLGRLHIQCQAQCNRILTCGHECDFPCTPSCPPCSKPCSNFCTHSHCPKMCYEPCAPCMEPCDWSCEHFQCTQPCGMLCNRPPCDQPCPKRLKCGHCCIGLCGELCPELCRICDEETVTEVFFGNEDENDARFILLPDCNHIIEVRALDWWMSTESTTDSEEIMLNVCPKCKTPVRRCLRYGNDIRNKLDDVEAVKRKIFSGTQLDLPSELTKVREALNKTNSRNLHFIMEELDTLERVIEKSSSVRFPHIVKAQLSFLLQIVLTLDLISGLEQKYTCLSRIEGLKRELNHLKDFIMNDTLSQQQLDDAESEMRRIMLLATFTELQVKLVPYQHQVSQDDTYSIQQTVIELEECGWKREKVSAETEQLILELVESFCDKYSIDRLSETERLEIVKAIGLNPGHWYKCPNGHYYAIGECGGAMQRGRCPECKADIGGMSHALAAGNVHAPEMDSSRYAAWSDAANMENYDLEGLQ